MGRGAAERTLIARGDPQPAPVDRRVNEYLVHWGSNLASPLRVRAIVGPSYERPLDAAETAVYDELRSLGCIVAVDPADVEDCAFVAVHAVLALRRRGLLGHAVT